MVIATVNERPASVKREVHPNSPLGKALAQEREERERLAAWVAANGPTPASVRLRRLLDDNRDAIIDLLDEYHATQPRLFGSVARGDANDHSDIDMIVVIEGTLGEKFWRNCGLMEGMRELLGTKVDVFDPELMKHPISDSALREAIAF